jgi:AhpD family alkylhydroperoxidase
VSRSAEGVRVPIDKQTPQVYRAYIEVVKAVRRATRDVGLDRTLVELVNVRVSQINGCASCLNMHAGAALAAGESSQRLAVLPAWRDTELFTDKEQAALILAESITSLPDARTQEEDYADASRHLSPDELSAICWVAITINAFNRISIVSRHTVRPDTPQVTGADSDQPAGRTTR